MATSIEDFSYDLPLEYIAQTPAVPRDASKLLVLDRVTGVCTHRVFSDIVDILRPGDVIVRNITKVFRARLLHDGVEVFVLRVRDGEIDALLRPGKKFAVGSVVPMAEPLNLRPSNNGLQYFTVRAKHEDGVVTLATGMTAQEMFAYCDARGCVPTPPYVTQGEQDAQYQTVHARHVGSVAAPTAGLHFTDAVWSALLAKGVEIEEVTLHVGIGTFRPVQTTTLEEHVMHSEWVSITDETAARIVHAKNERRRIIAVGTTTVRVLEGVTAARGALVGYEGEVNIFITPGFVFRVVDGLLTNFHLPKSTLLVLVSAFAGREHVLAAYEEAKRQHYRFFSFGDAMFVAPAVRTGDANAQDG